MCGNHFARPRTHTLRKRDGLFLAAVHAVDQLQLADAVVVSCFGFDQHFVDTRRTQVTPWLLDADRRRLISEHIDRILNRAAHHSPIGRGQFHTIEPVATNRESRRHGGIIESCERNGHTTVKHQRAARHRPRGMHSEQRSGSTRRRNVTAILGDLGR